jgi:hypothetical protein
MKFLVIADYVILIAQHLIQLDIRQMRHKR